MFNLKTYLKFLSKNKLYTFVNVFGLSVSLMFVILIANYTYSEFSVDDFQENADQIYALANEEFMETAYRVGERLGSQFPEIEKTCGVINFWTTVKILDDEVSATILAVDSTFLDMFSFNLLQGDREQALQTKHDVLVSESFARKMFGTDNPIGNIITISNTLTYTINGILEDFENSMFITKDIIMRVENMAHFSPRAIDDELSAGITTLFVQTTKGSDIKAKEAEVAEYLKTFYWVYKDKVVEKVSFIPLIDIYFDERNQWDWNKNDKDMLTILIFVGLLILLFAVFNYINLTVAQTGFRAKEIATRRLYGASRQTVLAKMIVESTVLCFAAFLIGYFLAFALQSNAENLISKDIVLAENISASWVLLSVLFVVILGTISGIIPAIAISSFQPIDVVKGTFAFKSKMTFSKVFITLQSVITIMLIASSLTIQKQVDYMINYDYGYNHDDIIEVWGNSIIGKEGVLRDKLKQLPSVKSVGFTCGTPFSRGENSTVKVVGIDKSISFQILTSDSATVKMLGIEFLKDNKLAEKGAWVNQTSLDMLGATDELKSYKREDNGKEIKIAGVVKEFVIGDLVNYGGGKAPLLWYIDENITSPWSILIEIQGDMESGYLDVKKALDESLGGKEFSGSYLTTQIKHSYREQSRIQKIMVIFSIIAMIISSLGLLAISSYFIQQRSREIAVRKVFGATRMEVLTLVIWKFMRFTVIAFFIAYPIIWYAMSQWLNDFSYRIDMSIWILIVAGIFNLVIAFLTVYWQSSRVANTNPIKAILE